MSHLPPPPGWYPDPWTPGWTRYWDGQQWTESTTVAGPVPSQQYYQEVKAPAGQRIAGAGMAIFKFGLYLTISVVLFSACAALLVTS